MRTRDTIICRTGLRRYAVVVEKRKRRHVPDRSALIRKFPDRSRGKAA